LIKCHSCIVVLNHLLKQYQEAETIKKLQCLNFGTLVRLLT